MKNLGDGKKFYTTILSKNNKFKSKFEDICNIAKLSYRVGI